MVVHKSLGKADLNKDKAVIGKEVADILFTQERGCWVFCGCLRQIMKWLCLLSFYHGLRVILSEVGILRDMSNREMIWPGYEYQASF